MSLKYKDYFDEYSRFRKTGRTTRIIDNMIQTLFKKGYVEMIPRSVAMREDILRGKDLETVFVDGYDYNDNRLTFTLFLRRLNIEHNISSENVKVEGLKATLIK